MAMTVQNRYYGFWLIMKAVPINGAEHILTSVLGLAPTTHFQNTVVQQSVYRLCHFSAMHPIKRSKLPNVGAIYIRNRV